MRGTTCTIRVSREYRKNLLTARTTIVHQDDKKIIENRNVLIGRSKIPR